eukprot:gb/GFBE01043353.1/.p1 GENE.gb/GFBE01043353.1/~~gb/GFBE01043353.1/.p1  ORF type:complete len:176 (+),score=28.37 gb/GFBE01043353.1/:1-528(+)
MGACECMEAKPGSQPATIDARAPRPCLPPPPPAKPTLLTSGFSGGKPRLPIPRANQDYEKHATNSQGSSSPDECATDGADGASPAALRGKSPGRTPFAAAWATPVEEKLNVLSKDFATRLAEIKAQREAPACKGTQQRSITKSRPHFHLGAIAQASLSAGSTRLPSASSSPGVMQ